MSAMTGASVGCALSPSWQRFLSQRSLARAPCSVTLRRGVTIKRPSWGRFLRGSPLRVASLQVEPVSKLRPSPSAQDIQDWDLEGWEVVLEETGEAVGRVEEVLSLASYWDPSVVEYCLLKVFNSSSPGIEYLIPWVEDVVKEVDAKAQCIFIKPPEGLLELAKRPELLRKIRVALENFGLHTEGQAEPHMPTRRQLQAAGEHKLVEMIVAAGGFSSVAQDLRFRTKRRPVGFWDDLRNLDSEIEAFLGESWSEEQDAETGKTYYINLITEEVLHEKPASASVMNPTPMSQDWSDFGTAVMPRARALRKMGRLDLHNAIMMHGGYKEVAQQLGRMVAVRRKVKDLESEILDFMRDHNLSLFPTPSQLLAENQDLLIAVREEGGVFAVAKKMGLRAQRNGTALIAYGTRYALYYFEAWFCGFGWTISVVIMLQIVKKGRWKNVEEAAEAMKAYMLENLLEIYPESAKDRGEAIWAEALESGLLRLPKQADIVEDGRGDLRYALQKFGQEAIADRLGIKVLTMRRPRTRHS